MSLLFSPALNTQNTSTTPSASITDTVQKEESSDTAQAIRRALYIELTSGNNEIKSF